MSCRTQVLIRLVAAFTVCKMVAQAKADQCKNEKRSVVFQPEECVAKSKEEIKKTSKMVYIPESQGKRRLEIEMTYHCQPKLAKSKLSGAKAVVDSCAFRSGLQDRGAEVAVADSQGKEIRLDHGIYLLRCCDDGFILTAKEFNMCKHDRRNWDIREKNPCEDGRMQTDEKATANVPGAGGVQVDVAYKCLMLADHSPTVSSARWAEMDLCTFHSTIDNEKDVVVAVADPKGKTVTINDGRYTLKCCPDGIILTKGKE